MSERESERTLKRESWEMSERELDEEVGMRVVGEGARVREEVRNERKFLEKRPEQESRHILER